MDNNFELAIPIQVENGYHIIIWVLDNNAGAEQGLPCVFYPKGSTWADAKTIMYAKIASTQYEDVDAFVATAIKEMEKARQAEGNSRDESSYRKDASALNEVLKSFRYLEPNSKRPGN